MSIDIKQLHLRSNVIYDIKLNKGFIINKIYSEQVVSHCRVIYLISLNGGTKQQFTEEYFNKLVSNGQLIIE